MNTTGLNEFYTIEAAATALGLKARTVTRYCRDGMIKAYKRGGRWYILRADLLEWIKGE